MRESTIERSYCKRVEENEGEAMKFVSPGRRHVPDRIILFPIPKRHQKIVAKYVYFAEFKAPGKKPRAGQIRAHARLRDMGFVVEVIDAI